MSESPVPTLIPQVRAALRPAYPELAAALRAASPAICARHTAEVKAQLPSAATLTDEAALDDLPVVLEALATTLESEDGLEHLARVGPAHAAAREGQAFTIGENCGEYVLFRRNVGAALVEQLRRPLTATEAEVIQSGLDGVAASLHLSILQQRTSRQLLESRALTDFATALAHDVRNEVAGLMVTLALFEETGRDSVRKAATNAGQSLVDEAIRCRTKLESTVAAMTRLLEADRLHHPLAPTVREVDLPALMEGVARSADRVERKHGGARGPRTAFRIRIDCPPQLVLPTDPDLLSTILTNLIENAVKYAPEGAIDFGASVEGSACRIIVRDRGPGLTPEEAARIFGKFQRGGTRSGSGMGLGLYVARRAADLLRARLDVESAPGNGSTFVLTLPSHRIPS